MKNLLYIVTLFIFMTQSALAQGCYMEREMEAEQGLRIHSELMVISLNCQHMSHKRGNLYILYREFTRKHQALFSDYERRLISFYQREGIRNPEQRLHQMRTVLANRVAEDAAQMRPDLFCRAYSERIPNALALDTIQVQQWAETIYPNTVLSYPVCQDANRGYNKG